MILTDFKVAASKNIGLVCPNCEVEVSRKEWAATMTDYSVCAHCNTTFSPDECELRVESGSTPALDAETARDLTWFHGTAVEDWSQEILTVFDQEEDGDEDNVLLVHIGTYSAAMERIAADRPYSKGKPYYLYELRLTAEASVSDFIADDENNWPDSLFEAESGEFAGVNAVRYLNRWETPGSISLLVAANVLEVVGVTVV